MQTPQLVFTAFLAATFGIIAKSCPHYIPGHEVPNQKTRHKAVSDTDRMLLDSHILLVGAV